MRSFHDSINWKNRLIGILGQKGVGKSTMILQHIKLYDKIDESLYVQADDYYFAGHRIYDLAFEAYRHFREWKPLEQTIEQAYRPYSGVEWHFACSMRSKGRHRAGVSAPQPPGTPLALLDELHEGLLRGRHKTETRRRYQRDGAEKDTKQKRGCDTKGTTRRTTQKINGEDDTRGKRWERHIKK